jgi:hypothetical protein
MSKIQSTPSSICRNINMNCQAEANQVSVEDSIGGKGLGVKAADSNGISVTAGEGEVRLGKQTLVQATVASITMDTDYGMSGSVKALDGSIGFGVRDEGESVQAGISAEIDVVRIEAEYKDDHFSLKGGVGAGVGFRAQVTAKDEDKDGNVEYCGSISGGFIGMGSLEVCVEMPAEKKQLPKPRQSLAGFSLRGNR